MKTEICEKDVRGGVFSGIIGSTLSLTVSTLIVKFIGLVYKIPIASILGDEGMGYFNCAYTVYAFFYLLCTAGVPKAVMIYISEIKAKKMDGIEKRIVRVGALCFLAIGTIMTLLLIVFSFPISAAIGNSRSGFAMITIAPSIAMVSLSGVIRGYLSACSRLLDVAVSGIIEGVGRLGVGLVLAMIGKRLELPLEICTALTVVGVSFGAFCGLIYLLICTKSQFKREKTGQSDYNIKSGLIIKRIIAISLPITLSAAILSLTSLIDLAVINRGLRYIGYSERVTSLLYGNYTTLAVPMLNLATSLITPISVGFLPLFTKAFIRSDAESLAKTERSAIDLTLMLCAPITVGLSVYSGEILTLLFPGSEINSGAALLCHLCPAILFSSLLLVVNTVLEASGRLKAPLISMLFGGGVKAVSSILLITRTELGVLGAPIGTVLSYAAALLVSLVIYGRAFHKHIPIFERAAGPFFCAAFSVFLSRIVYCLLINKGMIFAPSLILSILLAVLIYISFSYVLGMFKPQNYLELAKYTNL